MFQQKIKNYIRQKLEGYVRSYFLVHPEVKLIVVAGSVGKTSTKSALGVMLSQRYRVRVHEGGHNTELSAPLAILGIPFPEDVKSFMQWRQVFRAAQIRINQQADVDVIIQELGADHPGDIQQFGAYLRPNIAVITAVTAEHMEYFQTMDAVAREELSAANFSELAIINQDDIESQYMSLLTNPNVITYGTSDTAQYHFKSQNFSAVTGHTGQLFAPGIPPMETTVNVIGEHNLRPAVAAATVGIRLGMSAPEIAAGLAKITPVAGRMQLLRASMNSTIIDDSYNAQPASYDAAIRTFLSIDAQSRIAVLGSINELGSMSQAEHEKVGRMLHPDAVEWVITVGEDAEKYLAPAARANGCQVKSFHNAVDAGGFAHKMLKQDSLVLVKGSQNNIFLEEAVKILLLHPEDNRLLVRQSPAWMAHKEEFFAQFTQV